MVSYNVVATGANGTKVGATKNAPYIEGSCLSSDSKPTSVANGSKLLEMDTSTLFLFDAESGTWRAWS